MHFDGGWHPHHLDTPCINDPIQIHRSQSCSPHTSPSRRSSKRLVKSALKTDEAPRRRDAALILGLWSVETTPQQRQVKEIVCHLKIWHWKHTCSPQKPTTKTIRLHHSKQMRFEDMAVFVAQISSINSPCFLYITSWRCWRLKKLTLTPWPSSLDGTAVDRPNPVNLDGAFLPIRRVEKCSTSSSVVSWILINAIKTKTGNLSVTKRLLRLNLTNGCFVDNFFFYLRRHRIPMTRKKTCIPTKIGGNLHCSSIPPK